MYNVIGNLIVLWREAWLKPLYDSDIGSDFCNFCKRRFNELDFVTSCEFCEIGIIHTTCSDKHILNSHKKEILNKIESQRDRRLHDYQ
jgi:hypothetical protein